MIEWMDLWGIRVDNSEPMGSNTILIHEITPERTPERTPEPQLGMPTILPVPTAGPATADAPKRQLDKGMALRWAVRRM